MDINKMKLVKESKDYLQFSNGIIFNASSGMVSYESDFNEDRMNIFPYREIKPQLELPFSHQCNLECKYCSFRKLRNPVRVQNHDNLAAAISLYHDFLSSRHYKWGKIDFGVTGEPYLNQSRFDEYYDLIQSEFGQSSIRIFAGPHITNGLYADCETVSRNTGDPQDISCDGPREIHDQVRVYKNGKGTFDDVKKVLDQKKGSIGASAVITSNCFDISKIFFTLDELGFCTVYMKGVNLSPEDPLSINENNVDALIVGYQHFFDTIRTLPAKRMAQVLHKLNPEDFAMRYFYRIKDRHCQIYRCGCGKSGVYCDVDGSLYPCAHFMGIKTYAVGSLQTGISNADLVKSFSEATIFEREPCNSCWARFLCGGGCYYQSYLANGTISTPDAAKCKLTKALIVEAVKLFCHLFFDYPEILNSLPSNLFINSRYLSADLSEHYQPDCYLLATQSHEFNLDNAVGPKASFTTAPTPSMSIMIKEKCLYISTHAPQSTGIKIFLYNQPASLCLRDFADLEKMSIEIQVASDGIVTRKKWPSTICRIPVLEDNLIVDNNIEAEYHDGHWQIVISMDHFCKESQLGLNLEVCYDGHSYRLTRYEPFALLNVNGSGFIQPFGGEYSSCFVPVQHFIPMREYEHVPFGRYMGLKENVC